MNTAEHSSERAPAAASAWRVKRHHAALVLLALVSVFAIRARWFSGASQAAPAVEPAAVTAVPSSIVSEPSPSEPSPIEPTPAEPTMLGSWRDQYYGERTMTFLPDGKGTMLIMLDAVGQAIYGEKLLFHLDWKNDDGVLVMTFTGGEPKDAVATISKLWGATHEQKIELLTESELHLRSTDSQKLYMHKRVESGEAGK